MKTTKFKILFIDVFNIFIPNKIFAPFAAKKMNRVKVKIWFQTHKIEFYAAVKKDKNSGDYKMMLSKQKQKALGVSLGDEFEMQIFEDTSKYGVEMPEELEAVLMSDYDAYKIFEELTAGKKRSIIYGIIRYKKSQQKIDKALVMCENLKRGIRNPMELFKLP
ncbi:YdeI/OmpD-associated family protein [uncultured Polaribacter sp.]|uniref:YdeI/OmpD-associated family protein n=1 Tax=uncultured Polaribacter sp. TaxID=174711 RepID=UPI00260D218F|nr:YdeI/OmpD-associated family protein [uncultured Polaribacter sp.]